MINAGALAITSMLTGKDNEEKWIAFFISYVK